MSFYQRYGVLKNLISKDFITQDIITFRPLNVKVTARGSK